MTGNYSLLKIIKNKIGYTFVVICLASIICFIITLLCINNLYTKIQLFSVSIALFLFFIIYSIINIIKIDYYFRNGIETTAFVINEILSSGVRGKFQFYNLFRYYSQSFKKREGIIYSYYIDNQIYKSEYHFLNTNDTMFLKTGSIINILANSKNKNDTIIKDIYIK
jgi:hypothetical protein